MPLFAKTRQGKAIAFMLADNPNPSLSIIHFQKNTTMCGCNITGMKRKKRISGLGDAGSVAMSILPIVGGYVLANVVGKQFFATSQYGNTIKLGIGIGLASMTKGTISQLGVGMAINGAAAIVQPALEGAGLGLLPPGAPARYIAGFEGQTFDGQQMPFKF